MSRNFSSFLFIKQNLLAKLLVLIACACFVGKGWGQTNYTIIFGTPGANTWTIPLGVTSISVTCIGGGGAGGGAGSGSNTAGGGGGGGASVTVSNYAVTAGQTLTMNVGTGGVGVSNATGGTGGSTTATYSSTTFISAVGGSGGTRAANGVGGAGGAIASNFPANSGFKGGNGGNGVNSTTANNNSGSGGGGAGSTAVGANASNSSSAGVGTAGSGGATYGGIGATGVSDGTNPGANGISATATSNTFGGGGSGAVVYNSGSRTGGNGASGGIIITYTVPATVTILNFTASGSWTVPSNVCQVWVECWGAGGGGGGVSNTISASAGGGGGGAYSLAQNVTVTPSSTINYTIGAGGTGGTSGGTSGSAGGTTTFNSSIPVTANGGSGGGGSTSGTTAGTGGAGGTAGTFAGGTGASGSPGAYSGGGGASAGISATGRSATTFTGGIAYSAAATGGTPYTVAGTGANGRTSLGAGAVGANPGGGGSGGMATSSVASYAGGSGGAGRIVLMYTTCPCTAPTSVSASSNSPICAGATLNLTGAATGNTSWSWLGPNNFSSTIQSPSIASATTAASGTYFLTAQNSCGTGSGLFDNFSDNNFTSNPVWTPQPSAGSTPTATTWTSGLAYLQGANSYSDEIISTPSTQIYGSWKFDFQLVANVNTNDAVRFHMLSSNASLYNSNGYYVRASAIGTVAGGNGIQLYRIDNGTSVSIGSAAYTANTSNRTIIVTRSSNNVFRVYLDGSSTPIITTTADGTYTTSSFAGVWTSGNNASTNHIVDNIVCSNTLVDVTVNPTITTPTFTLGTASTRCIAAGSVTYTATSTGATGITYSLDAASILGGVTINSATGEVTYPLAWSGTTVITASAAGCGGPLTATHTVTILAAAQRIAPTGPQCSGTQLNFSATSVAGVVYAWTVTPLSGLSASPTTGSSNTFSTTLSNSTTADIVGGSAYISVTQTSNGVTCTTTFNPTIRANPVATVSSATLSVCGSLTSGSLGGNTPPTGTGVWTYVSGVTGTINTPTSPSSTFTASGYGTTVLRWTVSNAPCADASATVTLTFTPNIDFANTQSPTSGTICVGGTYSVFGKVFINGITLNPGVTSGLVAELGYSTSNSNPNTWTNWQAANFSSQVVNDDEYLSTLTGLAAGTYYYAFRYSYNGCPFVYGGTGGIWSSTANNGILTVYALPSVTMNPSTICNGATSVSVSASGGSTYELLVNGTSQGMASSTSSWTVPGPLTTGNTVCVRAYPPNSLVMNGDISEVFWGTNISNSGSGPGSGFGNNRINALYVRNGFGYLNLAVAGRIENDNKILLFLDTKTGGFNSLSAWSNRTNAPNNGLKNLNGGMQFDTGFNPDYVVSIGIDGGGVSYLDFYDMAANSNTYLGSTSSTPNLISYQTNTSASDYTKGYEIRIPINLIGSIASPLELFGMLTNNPNAVTGTTLSNQFLSPAGSSQGNYGTDVGVNFNNEPPNPVFYTLNSDCFTDVCRTVAAIVTPTFNQVPAICSGATLSALPTTSTNGITGTWAPALDNTQTTTYTFTPTAGLCATTTTMTITVNPLPSVIANSNSPFCAGQAINLTATDGFSTYAWSGPNSFSNATQNPSISNAQAVNVGTYTLTVTDGNGCQATSSTVVSLTTSPTAANNGPVCVGGALSLSTNSATSYSWTGPNSFTSSIQNPIVSASATTAMAGTYTVSVIGSCAAATGVVDNFSDGDFTANPVWTVRNGNWEVSFGALSGGTFSIGGVAPSANDRITTPSTQTYGTWEFQFQLETTAYGLSSAVRFFLISSGTDLTNTNGYYVYADGAGNLKLIRRTGATTLDVISTTYTANVNLKLIRVTRNFNGLFTLFLNGTSVGSGTDNTYLSSTTLGIWTSGFDDGDNPIIDNISCSPPASATTTVVVNSAPTISSKTGTICSGETYTLATASPDVVPVGTTYSWTFTANPSITGAAIGTTQSSFAQTLTNTSSMPQTIVYSVTPTVGSCSGTPFTVTITVDAPLNGGTVSTDQTICAGGTPNELISTLLPSGGSGLGVTGSVQIGTQIWMNSNLNVVNYNDGTPVGTDFTGTAGAYTWYDNSYPTWGQYYGALYNWYAVNTGKLCPSDWHVPTQAEWNTLINYVGNNLNAGKKLKSCRTVNFGCPTTQDPRWNADNTTFGTDDFNFSAFPAGRAYLSSGNLLFERVRERTRFWASTQNDVSNGDTYEFNELSSGVTVFNHPKNEGYSVRCMGDNATTIQNSYTYQWQQSVGCNNVWTDIPLANSNTYSPGALTQTTCFRRMITDACGTAYSNTITITVTPGPVITPMTATICSGETFSVTPVNGTNGIVPDGTTYTWSVPVISPASSITDGSAQATAQSSISQTLTNTTTSTATATYTVTATSGSCNYTFTVTVTVLPPIVPGVVQGISSNSGGPGHLVISQIYGGGGNASAQYTNDFVEIFNPTTSSVSLTGWSIQQASCGGSSWAVINLTGTIAAGGYQLISFLSSGGTGSPLPTPINASSTSANISVTCGKIALVNSTVALTTSTPTSPSIIDFVGFGNSSNVPTIFEGTSYAPSSSNTLAIFRASGGCTDTDVNSLNFSTGAPAPRTSLSPTNQCTTTSLTETICANATASSITATAATGSSGSFTYQWYSQAGNITCPTGTSTTGWNLILDANSLTYSPGAVTSTTTYALFIKPTGAASCAGIWATDCRKVVVNPAPIVTDMTTTICSGTAFSGTPVNITNGTVPIGTTYTWTVATNSNVTGQSAQATAQSSISQTLTNTTTTSQTVVYTVTPTFGTCVGATFTLTVTINPKPIMTSANLVVCTPNSFSYTPTGTSIPSGTTYSWSAPSGVNFTGGASGSGATTIDGALTLSSGSSATAVYTITPSSGSCSGSSFTLTIDLSNCAPPTPFTACNLVVYKVGDGSSTLSSNAAFPVSVQEISTTGAVVQSISNLFVGANLLTQGGTSASSGYLNSNNGYLAVPGLNSALGTASAPNENTKVTHIIDGTSTLISRTLHPTTGTMPFTANTYRSVVPVSATTFYCAGTGTPSSTGGVWYYDGSSFVQIYITQTNIRNLEIFNGNLYFSTATGSARGVYQIGTGLPTTSGQTATIQFSNDQANSSIYNFSISPDGCTAYLADDGTGSTALAGITKFTKSGGVWSSVLTYTTSGSTRGLVVDYSGSNPKIYATTAPSNGVVCNTLISLTDNGASFNSNWTLSAGLNYSFAGVDFTPNSTAAIANPITTQPIASANLCNTQTQTLSVTASGSPTYQWYSNSVNSICGATPILGAVNATFSPPTTGIDGTVYYFVKVSVNCSQIFLSNISAITTIINSTPTATNNGPICLGGTLTLQTPTVSGATYSWTGPNSFASSTQNPTVTTNASSIHQGTYSIITTVNGCPSLSGTTSVSITTSPSLIFLSPP